MDHLINMSRARLIARAEALEKALVILTKGPKEARQYLEEGGITESFFQTAPMSDWRAMIIKIALSSSTQRAKKRTLNKLFIDYNTKERVLRFITRFRLSRGG